MSLHDAPLQDPTAGDRPDPSGRSTSDQGEVRRKRTRPRITVMLAFVWLGVITGAAILAGLLPLEDFKAPIFDPRVPPSLTWPEFLGSDQLGRSMLSRVIYGARISLTVGIGSVALAMIVGGLIGMLWGYFQGRRTDFTMSVATDAILAFPPLLLLLGLATILERNLRNLSVALAVIIFPSVIRLARANTLRVASQEYVLAARAIGASHRRILFREIMPVIVPPLASYAFVIAAVVVVAEGSLSFLGLGIPPPNPSWGEMIAKSRPDLATDPYLVFIPGICLFLTVFSLNMIGDWARDRTNVRESAIGN